MLYFLQSNCSHKGYKALVFVIIIFIVLPNWTVGETQLFFLLVNAI